MSDHHLLTYAPIEVLSPVLEFRDAGSSKNLWNHLGSRRDCSGKVWCGCDRFGLLSSQSTCGEY